MVTLQDAINLPRYRRVLTSVNVPQRRGNPKASIGLGRSTEYQSEGMLVGPGVGSHCRWCPGPSPRHSKLHGSVNPFCSYFPSMWLEQTFLGPDTGPLNLTVKTVMAGKVKRKP